MYHSDLNHSNSVLEHKLGILYRLNRGQRLELGFRSTFLDLLKGFGDPHLRLPPVIHVAGTNGKGSVVAMLRSVFEAAGYRVHVYTSPHLVQFNERIVLAGQMISDDVLEALIDDALELHGDNGDISFFEITTAMAFAVFSRVPADVCLIEVGLGGRLDCTNVIEKPVLSIINTIGMDHTDILGNSLVQIATEKAGIMKHDAPCIIGPQSSEALSAGVDNVFINRSLSVDCDLFRYGTDWNLYSDSAGVYVQCGMGHVRSSAPSLVGQHQINNAGIVLAALLKLKDQFPVKQEDIDIGISHTFWPARMQRLNEGFFGFDTSVELWLDGGHNCEASQAVAHFMSDLYKDDPKPLFIVLGMMSHKDLLGFVEPFLTVCEAVHVVGIDDEPNAKSVTEIIEVLNGRVSNLKSHCNALEALNFIRDSGVFTVRILICGSLYLAGSILKHIEDQEQNETSDLMLQKGLLRKL